MYNGNEHAQYHEYIYINEYWEYYIATKKMKTIGGLSTPYGRNCYKHH